MTKLTLSPINSLQNETTALATINANNTAIVNAMENTLSRDGTVPNQLTKNVDMNSFTLINLPAATDPTSPVRLAEVGNAAAQATAAAASATAAATSATNAATSATNAASSATQAQGYVQGLSGTSITSLTIGTGSKSFTADIGKLWATGQLITASSNANSANYMHGSVTSYNSSNGALVVNVLDIGGSGTFADWNITISGSQGSAGPQGPSGAVGLTGTPSANQFATWNSSSVIQGVSITGLVKGNGASAPTAAVSGTDYAPATSGTAILKGSGAGAFANAVAGTDYLAPPSGAAILKANSGGALANATAGTDYMHPGTTSTLTKGFTLTPNNIGTVSSGTTTPDPTLGNYQYYTNNGAHTLAAPTSDCAIDILITNGASAGAITFTGFTVASVIGDALTTTNTNKFIVSIRRINATATYTIKALQ